MKTIVYFFLFVAINLQAQSSGKYLEKALEKFSLKEGKIIGDTDTIYYYMTELNKVRPKNLVVFIQGSDANPLFSYKIEDGEPVFYRWFFDDYKNVDSTTIFAIIPKPGMEGLYHEDSISIPKKYYENNYKEYRVNQLDQSIDDIINKYLIDPERIIVYGHSEGAAIASALALKNENITHLGFWSGNVLNNFYEFSLFNRIEALKGNISDSLAHSNILNLIDWYSDIIDQPKSTALDRYGFTNKRWSTYERAPIEELLEIDIPIYALFGSKDESTPVETAYLLPIQFMEHRKTNLTFELCINCDHGYHQFVNDETISNWDRLFLEFLEWAKSN